MTITMTHLSGESTYYAPPLRKEEIKAGISDFLATSSARSLLPALGRHLPTAGVHEGEEDYDDPWVVNALGEVMRMGEGDEVEAEPGPDPDPDDIPDSTPDLPGAQRRPRKRWRVGGAAKRGLGLGSGEGPSKTSDAALAVRPKTPGQDEDHVSHTKKHSQSPWQKQLRDLHLHPTEALIEAIFNPYPSASDAVSPFTYRVPSEPTPTLSSRLETGVGVAALGIGLGLGLGLGSELGQREGTGTGTDGTSRGSFDSSSPAGASASTSEQGHVGSSVGGHSGGSLSVNGDERGRSSSGHRWWRRRPGASVGSRPVTPSPAGQEVAS